MEIIFLFGAAAMTQLIFSFPFWFGGARAGFLQYIGMSYGLLGLSILATVVGFSRIRPDDPLDKHDPVGYIVGAPALIWLVWYIGLLFHYHFAIMAIICCLVAAYIFTMIVIVEPFIDRRCRQQKR